MVAAYDKSYDVLNQNQEGGAAWVVAGVLNIDEANGGLFYIGGIRETNIGKPKVVTIVPTPLGSANTATVTITFTDSFGNAITGPLLFDWWLSDAATGLGLTATAASGAVGAAGTGSDFGVYTAKKATHSQTSVAGVYVCTIVDTANTGFYVCVQVPGVTAPFVGPQLIAANY
jgi:hypothetical protein